MTIDNAVLDPSGKDAPKAKPDARGSDRVRMERLYAQAINDLILNIGQPNHSGHDGKPVRAVGLNEVREHLKRHGHLALNETGGLEVSARKALNRAKGDLLASGDFAGNDKMIWRIGNS